MARRIITRWEMLAEIAPQYSGLVLDQESVNRLLASPEVAQYMNPNWTVKAHHMTIRFGGGLIGTEHEARLGQRETIHATHIGMTDEGTVSAVAVDGISDNAVPHVTLAVDDAAGGEASHSNRITNWVPLQQPITLSGIVEEVYAS